MCILHRGEREGRGRKIDSGEGKGVFRILGECVPFKCVLCFGESRPEGSLPWRGEVRGGEGLYNLGEDYLL